MQSWPFGRNFVSKWMGDVVALVPARAGSKGVPDKNIRLLGGRPLIEWTIAACRQSQLISRTIVSTDSGAYADLAITMGAEAPFLRPASISGDSSTDYDFIVHALDWFAEHGDEPEFIVHMRPTTPLRDPQLVDEAIRSFRNAADVTALRSVQEMSESAYKTFEITPQGHLKTVGGNTSDLDSSNNARQTFPPTFYPNGYVDVLSTAFIRKSGKLHGNRVMAFTTPVTTEVDTEDDFALLEWHIASSTAIAKLVFG
ncbi:MAG: acylneuraminate cytidylyltransferase family protein [Gemmatimonadaceae bacterium]|nr:acylneuraminate cytidylyltransferase family protein [Gemmatimonadaceae bacterium]